MIQQSIMLHDEPVFVTKPASQPATPTVYIKYPRKTFTYADIQNERNKAAQNNIKIGSKFRYIKSDVVIEIVSYETNPLICENVDGDPAILKATRTMVTDPTQTYTFHYSVAEFLDEQTMERL